MLYVTPYDITILGVYNTSVWMSQCVWSVVGVRVCSEAVGRREGASGRPRAASLAHTDNTLREWGLLVARRPRRNDTSNAYDSSIFTTINNCSNLISIYNILNGSRRSESFFIDSYFFYFF